MQTTSRKKSSNAGMRESRPHQRHLNGRRQRRDVLAPIESGVRRKLFDTKPVDPKKDEIYKNIVRQHIRFAEQLDNQILSCIYSDVNLTSYAKALNNSDTIVAYCVDYHHAGKLLDVVLSHRKYRHLLVDSPRHRNKELIRRLHVFVQDIGWYALAICAFSQTFHRSVTTSSLPVWDRLQQHIRKNVKSLELFADMRALGAESLLLEKGILEVPRPRSANRGLIKDHPHHWVLKEDGTTEPPMYDGHFQENIEQNIFNPQDWLGTGITQDPTLRKPDDGPCIMCKSETPCECEMQTHEFVKLVELREYKGKGTGVRALEAFKEGQIIGVFVGELKPLDGKEDNKYSLVHDSKPFDQVKVLISPKRYGNWTRFINHSCDSSTAFTRVTVGRRTAMVVYAKRDIEAFEEVTVDYGSGYLETLNCKCGTSPCKGGGDGGMVRVL